MHGHQLLVHPLQLLGGVDAEAEHVAASLRHGLDDQGEAEAGVANTDGALCGLYAWCRGEGGRRRAVAPRRARCARTICM